MLLQGGYEIGSHNYKEFQWLLDLYQASFATQPVPDIVCKYIYFQKGYAQQWLAFMAMHQAILYRSHLVEAVMEEIENAIDDREGEVERLQDISKRHLIENPIGAECSHCHEDGNTFWSRIHSWKHFNDKI